MNIILGIYAVLMIAGGYMGYAKAGSKMSLIMGAVSGVVILGGLWLTKQQPQTGYGIIVAMTALLCISFTMRLLKTHAFMPSGMLLILSVAALIIGVMQLKATTP